MSDGGHVREQRHDAGEDEVWDGHEEGDVSDGSGDPNPAQRGLEGLLGVYDIWNGWGQGLLDELRKTFLKTCRTAS